MRQVFSSPRLENVEGVAKLLEEAGIEVRITNGRSYRSAIRGNFSYRDSADSGPRPAVWIVNSDDQPRARQLLREVGLLHTAAGPMPVDSYIPETPHMRAAGASAPAARRMSRMRYALLAGIVALVALTYAYVAFRRTGPGAADAAMSTVAQRRTRATPLAMVPETIAAPSTAYVIATPPALAEMLFAAEFDAQQADLFCLAIDGSDPPAGLLPRLAPPRGEARPASACADETRDRVSIDVARYRTDGSGVGTIGVVIHHFGDGASSRTHQLRRLEVQRTGDRWQVLRVL